MPIWLHTRLESHWFLGHKAIASMKKILPKACPERLEKLAIEFYWLRLSKTWTKP